MASSFIEYKSNGFWVNDGLVEAFQLLLFKEIQLQYKDRIDWLNEYKLELGMESLPLVTGGMSMKLDEMLTDEQRETIILQLVDIIRYRIFSDKKYLTGEHLNALRKIVREYLLSHKKINWSNEEFENELNNGKYNDDLPIESYQTGFDLLRKLINRELKYKPNTPITYWESH